MTQETKLGQKRMIDDVVCICIEDNGDRGFWESQLEGFTFKPVSMYHDEQIEDCPVIE